MPIATTTLSDEAVDAAGRVRSRDADPSWLAAVMITYPELSTLKQDILLILKRRGPSTDDEIFADYQSANLPRRTSQRVRTARHEMTKQASPALVKEHAALGQSALGNWAEKWEVAL
ncbi:hypothetical protein [Subtercola sp. RTI3]|uniref:hypothetical protein n=1 Tax=Subtercola sp. RTI3 TaxID=3048639 RepID=UPI002B23DC51|nr:hypothetical protein [Subtercola sp. RTI3]MEA9983692.1 hypothetical protein [Subtercola sp. RTI3]